MAIPDDYERDDDENDDDDEKYDKSEGGGGVNCAPASGRLYQTGTPDPYVTGHNKRPLSAYVSHDLDRPTLLVPTPEGPQPSSPTTTTATIPRELFLGGTNIALVAT